MKKNEKQRIKMLKKIQKDTNKVEVGFVGDVFAETTKLFFEHTNTGKNLKNKLTESEYIRFLTGFANSFLSTLYINASKNQAEMDERLKYVSEVNKDVLAYCEQRDKDDKIN